MTQAAEIRLSGLTKRFGEVEAVRPTDIQVPKGAFLVLVGPSGCGKSTMLRMLAGLDAPSAGEIAFAGKVVSSGEKGVIAQAQARDAGLVFQSYALWPHMTVAENIDWPLKVAGWAKDTRDARLAEIAGFLGIGGLLGRYPSEISGGQQQRAAIARTIAPKPAVLLFDEPLSNLDAKLRVEMRSELLRIHRATGCTSVYVTHDQVEALTMASHVAVMNGGRVEQFGPPLELLARPATAFVATFLGTPPGNLIAAVRRGDSYEAYGVALARARPDGPARVSLFYRAEDIAPGGAPGRPRLPVSVDEAAPMAGRVLLTARLRDGERIVAAFDSPSVPRFGDALTLSLPDAPAAAYAASGERIDACA